LSRNLATGRQRAESWQNTKIILAFLFLIASFLLFKMVAGKVYYGFFLPESVKLKGVLTPDLEYKTLPIKEAYRLLKETEVKLNKNEYGLTPEERIALLNYVQKEKDFIEQTYPVPSLFSLLSKNTYVGNKGRSVAFYLVSYLAFAVLVIGFFYYDRKVLRPFFLQVGKVEPALSLGNPFTLIDWSFFELPEEFLYREVFKSKDKWELLTAIYDKALKYDRIIIDSEFDQKDGEFRDRGDVVLNLYRIHYDVKSIVSEVERYGLKVGLLTEDDLPYFRAGTVLALFHYVLSFFGNVPIESYTVLLNDYRVKRYFTAYCYLNKTVNTVFRGVVKEKEIAPSNYLKTFHGYRREKKDFLKDLKDSHSQVPDII